MPKRKLIIVAASGFGREVAWAAREAADPWTDIAFLDDNQALQDTEIVGCPVVGNVASWTRFTDAEFVIAIGAPRVRRSVAQAMELVQRPRWATVIHRSAQISPHVALGEGTIICANVSITTNIAIGRHCIINLNSTIGHDVVLGDYCTLAPMVAMSGNVTLGDGVEIGTGASIRQGLTIGSGSLLGMGGVLTKDIAQDGLWMGSPAAFRRELPEWQDASQ